MAVPSQLLTELLSVDPGLRDAALARWRAEPVQSRGEGIAQLIASIRADREALWKLETEEYLEARFDPGFDNSAAQRETRTRAEASDRLLAILQREEVERAAAEVRDRESLLRLVRLIVRQCQGWRYGGWGGSPVFHFLEPALAWAEGSAGGVPPDPWPFIAQFLLVGCPVADSRDATYVTSASP